MKRFQLLEAVVMVGSALLWGAAMFGAATGDLLSQGERWAAGRVEAALNRELLRIRTEINSGEPGPIYRQYEAHWVNVNFGPREGEQEAVAALQEEREPDTGPLAGLTRKVWTDPKYPREAKRLGLEGSCEILFTVDREGVVSEASVEGCDEVFHPELERTAKSWRFEPFLQDGQPVEYRVRYPVRFRLGGGTPPETIRRTLYQSPRKVTQAVGREGHERIVADLLEEQRRTAALRADTGEHAAQLIQVQGRYYLVIFAPDSERAWVFDWDKVAAMAESRAGVRLTLEPERGLRRLAPGRSLVGAEVWLHEQIWTSDFHDRGLAGFLLMGRWPIAPSGNGPILLAANGLALSWLGLLLARRASERARDKAASEAREELLQRISHELRTPAASVLSMAGVLEDVGGLSSQEKAQFFGLLRDEAGRLAGGLDRLLKAARGEGETPAPRLRRTELVGWAEAAAARWRARLPALEVQAPGDSLWASADRQQLDEVVDVLLDNALKYGAAPVTLRLRRAGRWIRLEVEDGGPGVPERERRRIFEKLYRGAGADKPGGFGVGLWAAGEVARAHGGELTLEGGSCFVLTLPAEAAPAPPAP